MNSQVRVRFAPWAIEYMPLNSVRWAVINYLFAHKFKGTFILRVEDSDEDRNVDEATLEIIKDLDWLGLKYSEGPAVGGIYGPYFQSERLPIYQQKLNELIEANKVYRCFCSLDRLEQLREDQLSKSLPTRYDRRCLNLSTDHIKQKLAVGMPFIWRLKLNDQQVLTINDLTKGDIDFKMSSFSDYAITYHNGSCSFIFTNFVDDWMMGITHVIRGDEHLSNSGMQAALYDAFSVSMPKFWHLSPILNKDGKKFSKRDFGFSLSSLKKDGFLPQAICNYLATIGVSIEEEVLSLGELVQSLDFNKIHSTGNVHFDIDKLIWFNHKWIDRLPGEKLIKYVKPFLHDYLKNKNIEDKKLEYILDKVKTGVKSLKEFQSILSFCFKAPIVKKESIEKNIGKEKTDILLNIIFKYLKDLEKTDYFLEIIISDGKEQGLNEENIFGVIRYLLIGNFNGIPVRDIMYILENNEIALRLSIFFL